MTGTVYTPPDIAAELTSIVVANLPKKKLNVMEPSVGDGVFLNQIISSLYESHFTAVDIDGEVIEKLRSGNSDKTITFITSDFISHALDVLNNTSIRFDLVIGNPPFIRKHNFSYIFKETLSNFSNTIRYPYSDLKNSWVAFLIGASRICSDDGIVAFILPYELLTVAYGNKALRSMSEEFECIDIFIPKNRAFPDIEQDAVIFLGKKKSELRKGLYINHVENLSKLTEPVRSKLNLSNIDVQGIELNSYLLLPSTVKMIKSLYESTPRIEDFAGSAPGIVSAANDFFILKKEQVQELGFERYVIPILKKGSFIKTKISFTEADFRELETKEPCYLLSIKGEFEKLDKSLQSYIRSGEEDELHLRYKCRNRKYWYEIPIVPPMAGFFFKRSHSFPRLCLNQTRVHLTDTAYGINVKEGYTIQGLVYSFYNSLTMLFCEINGRFYGGGVLELSPKEFRGLPIIYCEPTEEQFENFLKLHDNAKGNIQELLDHGDHLVKAKLGLSNEEMIHIRNAWESVRAHRLRHGGRKVIKV